LLLARPIADADDALAGLAGVCDSEPGHGLADAALGRTARPVGTSGRSAANAGTAKLRKQNSPLKAEVHTT